MKITKKGLIKTAKELNELMGLAPAIKTTKEVTEEELLQQISMASEMLEEEDEISEVAEAVLDFIAEQEAAEKSPEPEDADDDIDEEDEEEEEDETTAQLVEKSDYRAMKAMVADYPEFKGIDINLYPIKKTEGLRARMLKMLAKAAEKETEAEVKKEEKNPAAKKDSVKKDTPAKKETGERKTPKQSGPGVIATIVSCIEGAGKKGITKDEILDVLVKTFPEKEGKSMKNTINVQVPSRISKERFKVENKDGKYFKA